MQSGVVFGKIEEEGGKWHGTTYIGPHQPTLGWPPPTPKNPSGMGSKNPEVIITAAASLEEEV